VARPRRAIDGSARLVERGDQLGRERIAGVERERRRRVDACVRAPSELELAVGEPRESVGIARIQADRLAKLANGRLATMQHEQVETILQPDRGLGRRERRRTTEEGLGDVRRARLAGQAADAQAGIRIRPRGG